MTTNELKNRLRSVAAVPLAPNQYAPPQPPAGLDGSKLTAGAVAFRDIDAEKARLTRELDKAQQGELPAIAAALAPLVERERSIIEALLSLEGPVCQQYAKLAQAAADARDREVKALAVYLAKHFGCTNMDTDALVAQPVIYRSPLVVDAPAAASMAGHVCRFFNCARERLANLAEWQLMRSMMG